MSESISQAPSLKSKPRKTKVAIIFGGRSAEHEISILSAQNIVAAIDPEQYQAILVGIDPNGRWLLNNEAEALLNYSELSQVSDAYQDYEVCLSTSVSGGTKTGRLIHLNKTAPDIELDVLFPVLHGPYGEDGAIQGLAKLANLPCVGPGILSSSAAMDKDICKKLLQNADLDVAPYLVFRKDQVNDTLIQQAIDQLKFPIFVKPANMGSSIGVSKAGNLTQLKQAISDAFQYDLKIILETTIKGREIECAVLGNSHGKVIASTAGEITSETAFYSYQTKYIDETGAKLKIPAELSSALLKKIQDTSIKAFKTLECNGMARVDMFVNEDEIIINELNTIPGFTKISMYPALWQASGLDYSALVSKLISLAMEDFEMQRGLKSTHD